MSSIRRADQISKIAYWAYLLLGLGTLIPIVLFILFEPLQQLGLTYLGFLIFVAPVLGTTAVILSIVRQRWGPEWKLLALLASTAIFFSISIMMDTGSIPAEYDGVVIVSFGAVTSFIAIWHFVSDR